MKCPECLEIMPSEDSPCPACGFSLHSASTILGPSSETPGKPGGTSTFNSLDSIDNARFVAGTMLAGRYRIMSLVGKGGMGEVYRADDLKLGQPVALKFLPVQLVNNGAALARFHREVRVARQVSHRNVCRVYDIGEIDDQHFLSMEFIKGEELSSLLHRIGRLPVDKAIQLARQICAGLAAAHETGILHRDLKPQNVMIDENGNARITDFGLAGLAEEFKADEIGAGTPAYMSPEQIEGGELTVKSDIYSLGLVLYELFTGKQAFVAATFGELINLRRSNTSPTTPTSIVKGFDPVIEKLIDRCIQKDPSQRPSSALQVAAALPGGDPIAAALAAGETPSPEMVAAAPKEGALRPPVAMAMLAAFFVLLTTFVLVGGRTQLSNFVPLERSPEVLRADARNIAGRAGYSNATDSADWFTVRDDMLNEINAHDQSNDRWERMKAARPSAITFRYRQSPRYLETDNGVISQDTPPQTVSGMIELALDTRGQLRSFRAVPPQIDDHAVTTPTDVDWSIFFTAAGLDQAKFRPAESRLTPRNAYDFRAAWDGAYPEDPQTPIRIEAAAFHGKVVYFDIVHAWDRPQNDIPNQTPGRRLALSVLFIGIALLAVVAGGVLTLRNMRLGRGDRRGAFRLAHFVFWVSVVSRAFGLQIHHVPTLGEAPIILTNVAWSLLTAVFFWVVYMALEPFVRRRWPDCIISWTRLLAGDFRDPMVGRDLLIGTIFGLGIMICVSLGYQIPEWIGQPPVLPSGIGKVWLGAGAFLPFIGGQLLDALTNGLVLLFLILLLSLVLRRDRLAFAIGGAVWVLYLFLNSGETSVVASIFIGVGTAILIIVPLWRYGLLAVVTLFVFVSRVNSFPVNADFSAWYSTGFFLYVVVMVAVAVYGFYTSLAGQKPFGGKFLEE